MTSISSLKTKQERAPITRRNRPRNYGLSPFSHAQHILGSLLANLPKDFHRVEMHQSEIIKCLRPCLPRKEVIQPHLPIRLPCYDFVPINNHTFGTCLLAVSPATSGTIIFRDVTGGVYKARERIHRSVADLRLLVIPASCRRVAACNPN